MSFFRTLKAICFLIVTIFLCSACSEHRNIPTFHSDTNPEKLSEWGQFNITRDNFQINESVISYELNTPLFSDYAHKLRTVWTPDQTQLTPNKDGSFDFPTGTVISKTFYYPIQKNQQITLAEQGNNPTQLNLSNHKLLETRLLVKRENGWIALPYVWNEEQSDAVLNRFGYSVELAGVTNDNSIKNFQYNVPDVNQCAACHQWDMNNDIQPIGLKPRHIKDPHLTHKPSNELDNIQIEKPLSHTRLIDLKAREYLDINCSHCHNPTGPANTSGLHLESFRKLDTEVGLCKLPIAAGSGTGGRQYDIKPGHAEDSIFTYRLESTDPAKMMPELGRSLVHTEGLELIEQWITSIDANCD